jgi:N6-adenine-specific methylase
VRACSVSGLNPQVKVRHSSARTYLSGALDVWDIVFVDPPYALPNEQVVEDLQQIAPHLAEGAIVVVERSARDSEPVWPKSVRRFAAKNHGETAVYYLEPDAAELSAEPVLGIAEKEN